MSYQQVQHAIDEEVRVNDLSKEDFTFLSRISDNEIFFAKERFKLHQATPDEGVSIHILKTYIYNRYGI